MATQLVREIYIYISYMYLQSPSSSEMYWGGGIQANYEFGA